MLVLCLPAAAGPLWCILQLCSCYNSTVGRLTAVGCTAATHICFVRCSFSDSSLAGWVVQNMHWDVVDANVKPEEDDPAPTVLLHAEYDEKTLEIWPYKFSALYAVRVQWAAGTPGTQEAAGLAGGVARCKPVHVPATTHVQQY
jgi:hypothetical protein